MGYCISSAYRVQIQRKNNKVSFFLGLSMKFSPIQRNQEILVSDRNSYFVLQLQVIILQLKYLPYNCFIRGAISYIRWGSYFFYTSLPPSVNLTSRSGPLVAPFPVQAKSSLTNLRPTNFSWKDETREWEGEI